MRDCSCHPSRAGRIEFCLFQAPGRPTRSGLPRKQFEKRSFAADISLDAVIQLIRFAAVLAPRRHDDFVDAGVTPQAFASLAKHHVLSVLPRGETGASVKVGNCEICRICARAQLDQHKAHCGRSKAPRLDQWQMSTNDQQRSRHTQEQHRVPSDPLSQTEADRAGRPSYTDSAGVDFVLAPPASWTGTSKVDQPTRP